MNFLITGLPKTGTTLLASILNGQQNVCCLELGVIKKIGLIKNNHDRIFFNYYMKKILHELPIPRFFLKKVFKNKFETLKKIKEYYKKYYKVENFGMKETFVSSSDICQLIEQNYKIIIIHRDKKKQFQSFVSSINKDFYESARHIKRYLNDIHTLEKKKNNNILLFDFDLFIKDQNKEIKKIEDFLGIKIDLNKKQYSFHKNIFSFKNNFTSNEDDLVEIRNLNIDLYLDYIYNDKKIIFFIKYFLNKFKKKLF